MTATANGPMTERRPHQPSPDRRITVALIPKVAAELQRLQDGTGLSKTDLVNRAITLYDILTSRYERTMTCSSGMADRGA